MDSVPENVLFGTADGNVQYYICQEGNELTEVIFDQQLKPADEVGTAKEGSPGMFLLLGEKVGASYPRDLLL